MSIRDFIARHSTPPSPTPIAAVLEIPKPIVLEPSNLDLEATAASSRIVRERPREWRPVPLGCREP